MALFLKEFSVPALLRSTPPPLPPGPGSQNRVGEGVSTRATEVGTQSFGGVVSVQLLTTNGPPTFSNLGWDVLGVGTGETTGVQVVLCPGPGREGTHAECVHRGPARRLGSSVTPPTAKTDQARLCVETPHTPHVSTGRTPGRRGQDVYV